MNQNRDCCPPSAASPYPDNWPRPDEHQGRELLHRPAEPLPRPTLIGDPSERDMYLTQRYCLRCQGPIPDRAAIIGQCEYCDGGYVLTDSTTFLRHGRFLHWQTWLPGLAWALLTGLVMCYFTYSLAPTRPILYCIVPIMMGITIGITTRPRRWRPLLLPLSSIIPVVGIVAEKIEFSAFGFVIVWMIFLLPMCFGCVLGRKVGKTLKVGSYKSRMLEWPDLSNQLALRQRLD